MRRLLTAKLIYSCDNKLSNHLCSDQVGLGGEELMHGEVALLRLIGKILSDNEINLLPTYNNTP